MKFAVNGLQLKPILKYIIKLMLVGTNFMIADIFTKPVDEETSVYM